MCPPALYCCVRLCLAILYICLPALGCCGCLCLAILCLPALDVVAISSFDIEKHKLFGAPRGNLSPRSVTGGVRLSPLAMRCWCPPFSVGHVAFLFICLPGLSLLVSPFCPPFSAGHAFLFICLPGLSLLPSALFRWPCSRCWCPPFSVAHAASLSALFCWR